MTIILYPIFLQTVQEAAAAICTAAYRAPELLDTPSHCTIDGKADVWAVGCTIYNMLYSRTPFESPVEVISCYCGSAISTYSSVRIVFTRGFHYLQPAPVDLRFLSRNLSGRWRAEAGARRPWESCGAACSPRPGLDPPWIRSSR